MPKPIFAQGQLYRRRGGRFGATTFNMPAFPDGDITSGTIGTFQRWKTRTGLDNTNPVAGLMQIVGRKMMMFPAVGSAAFATTNPAQGFTYSSWTAGVAVSIASSGGFAGACEINGECLNTTAGFVTRSLRWQIRPNLAGGTFQFNYIEDGTLKTTANGAAGQSTGALNGIIAVRMFRSRAWQLLIGPDVNSLVQVLSGTARAQVAGDTAYGFELTHGTDNTSCFISNYNFVFFR